MYCLVWANCVGVTLISKLVHGINICIILNISYLFIYLCFVVYLTSLFVIQ